MYKHTMIRYLIPLKGLKQSTNKIYAGTHWSKRKSHKDSVLSYANTFCRPVTRIGSYPVQIRYRYFFVTRALDTLNTAYLSKMFEDALRTIGILEDDSPKFVARTILEVVALSTKKGATDGDDVSAKAIRENEDQLEIIIEPYDRTT